MCIRDSLVGVQRPDHQGVVVVLVGPHLVALAHRVGGVADPGHRVVGVQRHPAVVALPLERVVGPVQLVVGGHAHVRGAGHQQPAGAPVGEQRPPGVGVVAVVLRPQVVHVLLVHRGRPHAHGGAVPAVVVALLRAPAVPGEVLEGVRHGQAHADPGQVGQGAHVPARADLLAQADGAGRVHPVGQHLRERGVGRVRRGHHGVRGDRGRARVGLADPHLGRGGGQPVQAGRPPVLALVIAPGVGLVADRRAPGVQLGPAAQQVHTAHPHAAQRAGALVEDVPELAAGQGHRVGRLGDLDPAPGRGRGRAGHDGAAERELVVRQHRTGRQQRLGPGGHRPHGQPALGIARVGRQPQVECAGAAGLDAGPLPAAGHGPLALGDAPAQLHVPGVDELPLVVHAEGAVGVAEPQRLVRPGQLRGLRLRGPVRPDETVHTGQALAVGQVGPAGVVDPVEVQGEHRVADRVGAGGQLLGAERPVVHAHVVDGAVGHPAGVVVLHHLVVAADVDRERGLVDRAGEGQGADLRAVQVQPQLGTVVGAGDPVPGVGEVGRHGRAHGAPRSTVDEELQGVLVGHLQRELVVPFGQDGEVTGPRPVRLHPRVQGERSAGDVQPRVAVDLHEVVQAGEVQRAAPVPGHHLRRAGEVRHDLVA